jgi:hypothetical protein
MGYLRVTVAEWDIDVDSAEGQAIVESITREGLDVFRRQPGFVDYRLVKAGPRTTVAVAEWESEDLGRAGAQRYRDWMQRRGIMQHVTLHTYDGPIVVNSNTRVTGAAAKGQDQGVDLPDGLAQPARRALLAAGYSRLELLAGVRESDLRRLHGIGPNALKRLRLALEARGLSFRPD